MPDDSCRICGGELISHTLCSDCRKATQKKCRTCTHITLLQSHQYCVKNSPLNQKQSLVQIIQKEKVPKAHKNSLHFLFLAIGVVSGFFILGLIDTSHTGVPQGMPEEAQATDTNNMMVKVTHNFPTPNGKSYENCIAYGSGESITVTCPTDNGSVYKGIFNMPQDLKNGFSDSVFSIRGVSITENHDGSVILQYHVKKYVTNYFGN
jgi:hypothetical protein